MRCVFYRRVVPSFDFWSRVRRVIFVQYASFCSIDGIESIRSTIYFISMVILRCIDSRERGATCCAWREYPCGGVYRTFIIVGVHARFVVIPAHITRVARFSGSKFNFLVRKIVYRAFGSVYLLRIGTICAFGVELNTSFYIALRKRDCEFATMCV